MYIHKMLVTVAAISLFAALPAADHDHDHDHVHEGHSGEAKAHEIGDVTIGKTTYGVSLHGQVEAGKEAIVTIAVEEGNGAGELRVWVGIKDGRGSVKALLKPNDKGSYHGHLEVPAILSEDSALWLEVVTDEGRKRGSVDYSVKPESDDHDHDEGQQANKEHDHDH